MFFQLRTGFRSAVQLQALVNDILPLTTAVTDYAIGLKKKKKKKYPPAPSKNNNKIQPKKNIKIKN